jgi:hypothetical protein
MVCSVLSSGTIRRVFRGIVADPQAHTNQEILYRRDWRAKGIYFKCDEKFVSGHRDVCKRLFYIEVVSDDEDDDDPTISIHAFTSIHPRATSTMQLLITISGVILRALLDSGSAHNFIDTVVTEHVDVTFQRTTGLCVTIANGGRLS